MRLEQLQAFLAVAETGSFQAAARRRNVTQSTISRQIQALESELGLPLLHRSAQAKPTVGGDYLLPRARKICQEWQQVSRELADLLDGLQPELCIAAIHSVCAHLLPPVLQKFCQSYPQIQLRVTALGSDRSLKVLRDGLVDVAIVMDNPMLTTSAEMVVESLYEEPVQVLMAATHPLNDYRQVPWEALAQYPQVTFKDGYGMQRLVQKEFQKYGVGLQSVLELNTLDSFRGVVRQGDLIAMLPRSALLDCSQDPTLAIRSTESPILSRQVVMVTTGDRLKIPPIQTFFNLVKQCNQQSQLALA